MKFDKYTIIARLFPALITLIPFLLFTINCKIDGLGDIFSNLLQLKVIGNITIAFVLLYFLMQTNRYLGKFLFEKIIFKNELDMPTTRYLLYQDTEFSSQYKDNIRQKVYDDFHIEMPKREEELININSCKKRIVETVGLIRNKVKNGNLLLQHNIEYGFARNLIGGSLIAVVMSIIDMFYFIGIKSNLIVYIAIFLTVFFSLCLILSTTIINHLGSVYARRLFQEYL
jgi:hypothetical protein